MASELQEHIDRISAKMQILLERYNRCDSERQQAQSQVRELTEDAENLLAQNQKLQQDIDYLRIASTIVTSRDDVENTRALLSELVREIDKCITELNE